MISPDKLKLLKFRDRVQSMLQYCNVDGNYVHEVNTYVSDFAAQRVEVVLLINKVLIEYHFTLDYNEDPITVFKFTYPELFI